MPLRNRSHRPGDARFGTSNHPPTNVSLASSQHQPHAPVPGTASQTQVATHQYLETFYRRDPLAVAPILSPAVEQFSYQALQAQRVSYLGNPGTNPQQHAEVQDRWSHTPGSAPQYSDTQENWNNTPGNASQNQQPQPGRHIGHNSGGVNVNYGMVQTVEGSELNFAARPQASTGTPSQNDPQQTANKEEPRADRPYAQLTQPEARAPGFEHIGNNSGGSNVGYCGFQNICNSKVFFGAPN